MKLLKSIAVASLVAALPLGASALPVQFNVLNSSSNTTGANQAEVFAPDFGAYLAAGASWVPLAAPTTVTPPPGSLSGAFLSPWANTTTPALGNINSYFVVQPIAVAATTTPPTAGSPASPDPAKLKLGGIKNLFTLLWGSIDVQNSIEFFNAGSSVGLGSITGSELVGAATEGGAATLSGCSLDGTLSYRCVAKVEFTSDTGFDEIWFHAGTGPAGVDARNSFEFATVPVPAAAWLLLGVSGALVAAKRRSSRKVA